MNQKDKDLIKRGLSPAFVKKFSSKLPKNSKRFNFERILAKMIKKDFSNK